MPDITMCNDTACPLARQCYRANAQPSMRQSYFTESPRTGEECDYFYPQKTGEDEMQEYRKTLRPCSDFTDRAWYLYGGAGQDEPHMSDPSGEILLVEVQDAGEFLVVQRFYPRAEVAYPNDMCFHADDLFEFDGHNNVLISYGAVSSKKQCEDLLRGLIRFHEMWRGNR